MRRVMAALAAFGLLVWAGGSAMASGETAHPPNQDWPHEGIFGTFDRGALQRGYQVFEEVCSSCHSLEYIAFRNLVEIGFSEDDVNAIAGEFEVEDGPDDEGEMFTRSARAYDYFPAPFPNPQAARAANGGSLPPDLSLITKAREGGADYLYGLLTGYEEEAPEGVELGDGVYYNTYFPGHQIAMPLPLDDDLVEYVDGTDATTHQMAWDVTTFLAWAAEPELEERKRTGLKVLIFIGIFTALLYVIYRRIAAKVHHI